MSGRFAGGWPQGLARLLTCATFLLINVGGTVTTYDAGMAVPDWPTTQGDWFYPLPKWAAADWDVFLEHGHRMLGAAVGIAVIALTVALWRLDRRKWMRWLGLAALGAVILQGVIGGFRVLGDELLLAKVHGCTAPLFFALCVSLVVLTSRRWQQDDGPKEHRAARGLHRLALALTVALYLEIVLGAQLRHVPPDGPPGWSVLWVWLKLITAGLIAVGVVWLMIHVLRRVSTEAMLVRRAKLLAALLFLQLLLGAGTWVANIGWPAWIRAYVPAWFKDHVLTTASTVQAVGAWQVLTTTTHAAVGALSLVAALSLMLWSRRLLRGASR